MCAGPNRQSGDGVTDHSGDGVTDHSGDIVTDHSGDGVTVLRCFGSSDWVWPDSRTDQWKRGTDHRHHILVHFGHSLFSVGCVVFLSHTHFFLNNTPLSYTNL